MNDELMHYAKGQTKKNPKYIRKEGDKYFYEDSAKNKQYRELKQYGYKVNGERHNPTVYDIGNIKLKNHTYARNLGYNVKKPTRRSDKIAFERLNNLRAPENKIIRKGFDPETEGSGYEGAARNKIDRELASKYGYRIDGKLYSPKSDQIETLRMEYKDYDRFTKMIKDAKMEDIKKNMRSFLNKGKKLISSIFRWGK